MLQRFHIAGFGLVLLLLVMATLLGASQRAGKHADDPPATLVQRVERLEVENASLRAEVARLDTLQADVVGLEGDLEQLRHRPVERPLWAYPIPSQLRFCGETLPLDDPVVHERLEAEWYRFLVNRHWVLAWMRRSREVFPVVEAKLKAAGLPDDLKYVMVIESAVDPRATSSAGAVGYWQFTRSTGHRYGLRRTEDMDERRDLAKATDAAIAYLRDLHDEFQSWPLVLAAYNAGERRIEHAIHDQGTDDFYAMALPRETEAYWFKAAVVKVFFQQPARYGFVLPHDGWEHTPLDTLVLSVHRREIPFREIGETTGLSYRRLKELNPQYRGANLPRGEHRLVLPHAVVAALLEAYPSAVVLARGGKGDAFDAAGASATEDEEAASPAGPARASEPVRER